ncbi:MULTISPECIES: hypothetical protein [unclassified Streptomyces]|uniref:hypothetical protein n=1 Tax=unclassified Streptomyces TaxID=2593676 RepID=UPI0008048268|nr:hypothetical protein [Streptomyces sp. OspMP-M45]MYR76527.1 hypothetical protein [Streptomyces sp. SID4925]SBU99984.1 hypothetical protein YUMDRAFT_06294 [Streptomyces sp. OspMP-M45]
MSDAARRLGEALSAPVPIGAGTVSAEVVDVTDEGVNVLIGGALILDVPCLASYRDRARGDWVVVRPGARPVVLGRTAPDPGPMDEPGIRAVAKDVALDEQVVRAATWGTGTPSGTGWQQVQSLFMRKTSAGKVELYGQLAIETDPSPGTPGAPAPKPVTLTPSSIASYRGGSRDESRIDAYQGDWTGRGNLRGGFFYGTSIAAACAGKTVASMKVALTRVRGAGVNGRRPVQLYLHAYTSPPSGQLSLGDGPEPVLSLTAGASGTATLPAAWRSALAAGTARGLAVYADGSTNYMALTGGKFTITFSA